MGLDGNLYQAMVVIHILTVVFGLGPLVLAGVLAAKAKAMAPKQAAAAAKAQYEFNEIASKIVYLIFITGVAAVLMSDRAWELSDLWVSVSMLTYIVALGISHGMVVPNHRRIVALQQELADLEGTQLSGPPEQAVELADRGKRAAALGFTMNLLTAFLVYLMVFKPT